MKLTIEQKELLLFLHDHECSGALYALFEQVLDGLRADVLKSTIATETDEQELIRRKVRFDGAQRLVREVRKTLDTLGQGKESPRP